LVIGSHRELAYILAHSAPDVLFADSGYAPTALMALEQAAACDEPGLNPAAWATPVLVLVPTLGGDGHGAAAAPGGMRYEQCFEGTAAHEALAAGLSALRSEVASHCSPEDAFQLYYTSGTTGRPKAAVLSHRIIALHALGAIQGMRLGCSNLELFKKGQA
jgi:acyl-CoA synthetase (AMP-forming)/AMP-acid ligase II